MPITARKPLGNTAGNFVEFTEQASCEHPSGMVTIILENSAEDATLRFRVYAGIDATNYMRTMVDINDPNRTVGTFRVPWAPYIRVITWTAAVGGTNSATLIY